MKERNIVHFIKQPPCIPATKGVRIASKGVFLLFLPIASVGVIVSMIYDNDKTIYILCEAMLVLALATPIILQKYYADRIASRDNTASTYWLIGTLISLIVAADTALICYGVAFSKSRGIIPMLIIASIIAALVTYFIATYWCRKRITHCDGELNLREKVINHPALITPIIMTVMSYTSSNVQIAMIVFIISFENAILGTGLAQTILKLRLAKAISAEAHLPKYMP